MGKHFPLFEILELLGQGGMGIVYKAKQRSLDRLVALKVMPPDAARDAGFADRFSREARTLARLQHPNIVGVHDFGVSDGLYYLVMEYVDGANLREAIRSGKLSAREALAIVPQICDALQYAHDQGVVHRDIKPENILLDRAGRVRIADFGLAKIVQRTPLEMTLTRQGQVMGTLHYMAPEQYRTPDAVDHRADIYSLGVVFYEMLTGELPIGSFPPPSDKAGVDARLDRVVLRALERERDRRWQHASELKTQVSAISSGAAAPAAPPTTPAMPAAPAASVPPPPPAAPFEPRLSRIAVAGGLAVPGAFVVGALAWGITELLTHGEREDQLCPLMASAFGGMALLVGTILSITAWVQIHKSHGRLTGIPWAVVGTFLSPIFLCCGFSTFPMLSAPGISIKEGPGGTRVSIPGITVEDGPGGTRVSLPGIDIHESRGNAEVKVGSSIEIDARLVRGGPAGRSAPELAAVAREIRALWKEQSPGLFKDHANHLKVDAGGASLDLCLHEGIPEFKLYAVVLAEDGKAGRAVWTDAKNTLSLKIEKVGERWALRADDAEWRGGPATMGDEDGRLRR